MAPRLTWTPEDDQRLLSLVDSNFDINQNINCDDVARRMNRQLPLPPTGIHVKTYLPTDIHTRLYELLQPRFCFLMPPVHVANAEHFDLGLKLKQSSSNESGSSSVTPSGLKSEPKEGLMDSKHDRGCERDQDEYLQLERYGEPELYAELFPKLLVHEAHEYHDLNTETVKIEEIEDIRAEAIAHEERKNFNEQKLVLREVLEDK